MSISSLDDYVASTKQPVTMLKTASQTAVAANPTSVFDKAGTPGAGTLSAGNTANGLVRSDGTTGFPAINAFGASAVGYLSRLEYNWDVPGVLQLYDQLFSCGAYAFNTDTTLGSQPSYLSRLPGGVYSDLELWIEWVTAGTGAQSVQVNYTDQDGNTGADTGVIATGITGIVGQMFRMPLAAGDNGLQKIERVRGTVASGGTFNVHVMRPLALARVHAANVGGVQSMLETGLKQVFADSALFIVATPDSTSTGKPWLRPEIANR